MNETTITIVNLLLCSSVLPVAITSIVSIRQYNKETRLKRITDERTRWRDEIRIIAERMSKIDCSNENCKSNLRIQLNNLKLRINAYGILETDRVNKTNNYTTDSHIWNKINELENSENVNEEQINQLIEYLSVLLKYDWERCKLEAGSYKYYNGRMKKHLGKKAKRIEIDNTYNVCLTELIQQHYKNGKKE